MAGFTSEDRNLFHEVGLALYEDVLEQGAISADDDRLAAGTPERAAFELLVRIGLLQQNDGPEWHAVDPAGIQAQVVSPLSTEGTRLLDESSRWAHDFASITTAWRRSPEAEKQSSFSYLKGQQILSYITGLAAEVEDELLTAQPQERRETGEPLARAIATDGDLLRRGAQMRTLYQHAARRSQPTREYVAAVSELGAEVRTLDEFFNRMLIFDRRVAVIPSPDGFTTALAVREPTVVAYLVDVFERSWERARPFTSRDAGLMRDIAVEQRAMTMRMLIEGHSDPSASKRLGVSPRTYAGYIADLKKEFDVETRFQLGYALGQRAEEGEAEQGAD